MPEQTDSLRPVTHELAEFVHGLDPDRIPGAVEAQMAVALVDFFRVGCAGLGMPWVAKLQSALAVLGGTPSASVLYSDTRTDPVRAALLNGVIAGSLDWDDTHVGAMLHPGAVVWPAVLAVGEAVQATGQEMLSAAAAGYETVIRVGLGIQPAHFQRGFQSTATCGVFGSAAAAARLMGLGPEGIRDALGLAASYAGGVTQFFLSGSEVKRIHAGKAAAAGTESALLARSGLTGPRDALEGLQGFGRAMGEGIDPDAVLVGLGRDYRLLGLQFKPHAVSARILAAVECAERLAGRGTRAEEIEAVEIGVPSVVAGRLTLTEVQTLQQAQMSGPFAVALALTLGPGMPPPLVLGLKEIEAHLADEAVRGLLARTTCVVDDEIERGLTQEYCPARVTLRLSGGRRMEETVMIPKGSAKRPMDFDEVAARFRTVVAPVGGEVAVGRWLEAARDPARLTGTGELMTLRAAE